MAEFSTKVTRQCSGCHEIKEVSLFYRRGKGFDSYCIPCRKHISLVWKNQNKDWQKGYNKKRNTPEIRRQWKNNNPLAYLVSNARANAKKHGRICTITKDHLLVLFNNQQGLCYYTGRPMYFGSGTDDSVSLDRINSLLGYTPDNIVLCQYKVNVVKNNLTISELLEFCKDVLSTLNG